MRSVVLIAMLVAVLMTPLLIPNSLRLSGFESVYAAAGHFNEPSIRQNDDDGDNDEDEDEDNDGGDNEDGDNEDRDNEDRDNEGDDNDNDEFDDNDNFDDFGLDIPPLYSPRAQPRLACSEPGEETSFASYDDKVHVRVFASTPRPVRVEILQIVNLQQAPSPPGQLVGLLAYEIQASYCDANLLPEFPAEVNLGIRYSDDEAAGMNEDSFVIGRLDLASRIWIPTEKQATDPAGNYVSATILATGYYMVWVPR
jgi:hypothetical protein